MEEFGEFYIQMHVALNARAEIERTGYHCSCCKAVYLWADYTIESMTHVLGNPKKAVCCGKERPTPFTFETIEHAEEFLRMFEALGPRLRAQLIEKGMLMTMAPNSDEEVTERSASLLPII